MSTDHAADAFNFVEKPDQTCIDNIVKCCEFALRSSKDAALQYLLARQTGTMDKLAWVTR